MKRLIVRALQRPTTRTPVAQWTNRGRRRQFWIGLQSGPRWKRECIVAANAAFTDLTFQNLWPR